MIDAIKHRLRRLQQLLQLDLRYVIHGNFWLLVGRVVAVGSGMLLTIAFANLLTPETYGFYKYVVSIAGIVTAFSLSGIGTALINSIARGDAGTLRTTFWPSFRWALLASSIAAGVAGWYFLHHNAQLGWACVIIALATPVFQSFGNYRQLFVGRADFKANTVVGSVRAVLPIAAMIITVFLTQDPLIVVLSYFLSNALTVIALWFYTLWKYRVPKEAESTESTLRFARYTSFLAFFNQLTSQIDQFLVWHFAGPAAVAYYSFATSPVEQLQGLAANVFSLVAPKLATKSDTELKRVIPLRMKQMLVLMVPFVFLYILAAPLLYHYLFHKYESVVWLSQLYALVLLLQPQGFVDAALIAREDTGKRNFLVMAGQIAKLVFLVAGIYLAGITGGIIALIVSEVVNMLLALIVLARLRRA